MATTKDTHTTIDGIKVLICDGQSTYFGWKRDVKLAAENKDVWKLLSEQEKIIPRPDEPSPPNTDAIKKELAKISTADEISKNVDKSLETYKMDIEFYKLRLHAYEDQQKRIRQARTLVLSSVSDAIRGTAATHSTLANTIGAIKTLCKTTDSQALALLNAKFQELRFSQTSGVSDFVNRLVLIQLDVNSIEENGITDSQVMLKITTSLPESYNDFVRTWNMLAGTTGLSRDVTTLHARLLGEEATIAATKKSKTNENTANSFNKKNSKSQEGQSKKDMCECPHCNRYGRHKPEQCNKNPASSNYGKPLNQINRRGENNAITDQKSTTDHKQASAAAVTRPTNYDIVVVTGRSEMLHRPNLQNSANQLLDEDLMGQISRPPRSNTKLIELPCSPTVDSSGHQITSKKRLIARGHENFEMSITSNTDSVTNTEDIKFAQEYQNVTHWSPRHHMKRKQSNQYSTTRSASRTHSSSITQRSDVLPMPADGTIIHSEPFMPQADPSQTTSNSLTRICTEEVEYCIGSEMKWKKYDARSEDYACVKEVVGDFRTVRIKPHVMTMIKADQNIEQNSLMILDSGASICLVNDKSFFTQLTLDKYTVGTANDPNAMTISGTGTIKITLCDDRQGPTPMTIGNVCYAPDSRFNIISMSWLAERAGFHGGWSIEGITIVDREGFHITTATLIDGLYYLQYTTEQQSDKKPNDGLPNINHHGEAMTVPPGVLPPHVVAEIDFSDPVVVMHRKLGHLSMDSMRTLLKMSTGMNLTEKQIKAKLDMICPICATTKAINKVPKEPAKRRMKAVGDMVHVDTWGPYPVAGLDGERYILAFTDDAGRFTWGKRLRFKDEITPSFIEMFKMIERTQKCKIGICRIDNEFLTNDIRTFISDQGTILESSVPYDHHQAGTAERTWRTQREKASAMMHESNIAPRILNILDAKTQEELRQINLPENLWSYSFLHAMWLKNRAPTRALKKTKTPWEFTTGHKPDLGVEHIFGSRVYVVIPPEHRRKSLLNPRAWMGYFVGHETEAILLVYHPDKKKVFRISKARIDDGQGLNDPQDGSSIHQRIDFDDIEPAGEVTSDDEASEDEMSQMEDDVYDANDTTETLESDPTTTLADDDLTVDNDLTTTQVEDSLDDTEMNQRSKYFNTMMVYRNTSWTTERTNALRESFENEPKLSIAGRFEKLSQTELFSNMKLSKSALRAHAVKFGFFKPQTKAPPIETEAVIFLRIMRARDDLYNTKLKTKVLKAFVERHNIWLPSKNAIQRFYTRFEKMSYSEQRETWPDMDNLAIREEFRNKIDAIVKEFSDRNSKCNHCRSKNVTCSQPGPCHGCLTYHKSLMRKNERPGKIITTEHTKRCKFTTGENASISYLIPGSPYPCFWPKDDLFDPSMCLCCQYRNQPRSYHPDREAIERLVPLECDGEFPCNNCKNTATRNSNVRYCHYWIDDTIWKSYQVAYQNVPKTDASDSSTALESDSDSSEDDNEDNEHENRFDRFRYNSPQKDSHIPEQAVGSGSEKLRGFVFNPDKDLDLALRGNINVITHYVDGREAPIQTGFRMYKGTDKTRVTLPTTIVQEGPNRRTRRSINKLERTMECLLSEAHKTNGPEPRTLKQARTMTDANQWEQATNEEYQSLIHMNTWTVVPRPGNRKVLGSRWVYKRKIGTSRKVLKYKARFVVKGFSQIYGLDFDETYALVVKALSYRLLFALQARYKWFCYQLDIKTAFLNGELDHEIYVEPPEGFSQGKDKVLRLNRSLYSLKQSLRVWYIRLRQYLESIGWKTCQYDQSVFVHPEGMYLAVYVDDILIFGPCENRIVKFK